MSLAIRLVAFAAASALAATGTAAATVVAATPAAAAKPATTNWLDTVVATPQGGIRQGNPNAKVKLLEFGSLSCPHCGAFARDHLPELRAKYIATGKVCYEYRPFIIHGVDFAPSLLVECLLPVAALKLIDAFYAHQAAWIEPFTKPLDSDFQQHLATLPEEKQITAFAVRGGLDGFMRTRGMSRTRFDACTGDKAGIARLAAIRDDATKSYGLTAVPTFVINGHTVADVHDWAHLQTALERAV